MRKRNVASADLSLLQKLSRLIAKDEDEIPEGWHTVKEWAEIWDCSEDKAHRLLRAGKKSGDIVTEKYRIKKNGHLVVTPYYAEA